MKKNILLLINGFGVEQKDSYNIYSADLMPNLDRLTKDRIFSTIISKELDYKEGYRKFSIGINEPLSYSLIERDINNETFNKKELFKSIVNNVITTKTKLHIFCYYDSPTSIEHLILLLREMTNINVFVHIILDTKSVKSYKEMSAPINKLNYEYPNVKIGIVCGSNYLLESEKIKEFQKSLVSELGEKWKDIDRKLEVLTETKTYPSDARVFNVNDGFKLENNDSILLFNYSYVDIDNFKNELANLKYDNLDAGSIKYYSLFPVKSNTPIPFVYNYAVSSTYALGSLNSINASCLVIDEAKNCQMINYYMTGLRNENSEKLKYMDFSSDAKYTSNYALNIVQSAKQELVILNYEITTSTSIEDLKQRLSKIDTIIGALEKYCLDNNYALIISSLYGMEKELYNAKAELCYINFSKKVPVVIVDKDLPKTSYNVNEGSLYDLSNTIFKNMSKEFKGRGILKKKSSLLRIFYKKPKETK